MNKKIKNILLVIIAIAVVGGIGLFCSINKNNLEYMQYKDFYTELENGNIKNALIEDDKVQFSINDKTYFTENPNYEGFKEKLLLKGVDVEVSSAVENFNFVFDLVFYAIFFGAIILGVVKFLGISRETLAEEAKINFIAAKGADFQSAMMSEGSRKIKTLI